MNVLNELEKRPLVSLAILLGLSLLIKAILIYQVDVINPDGLHYISSARELSLGNIADAFKIHDKLGYTLSLALMHLLVPDWFLAAKILSCISLVVATVPLYYIANDLFGRRSAFFCALAFTVAPSVNSKCSSVIKEPLFLLLVLLSLWFVLYAIKECRYWVFSVAGFLSSLSVLVRYEGAIFILLIVLFLTASVVFLPGYRRWHMKCLAAFCSFPLVVLLIITAVGALNDVFSVALTQFAWRYSHYIHRDHLKIYWSIYNQLKALEESFPGGRLPNDFFEYARYNMYLIYLIGLVQVFCKMIFVVFLVPLILGLNLKNRWRQKVLLLLTVLCGFFFMNYYFLITRNFISGRYLFVPIVLSYVFVGHGLDRMFIKYSQSRFRNTLLVIFVILCIVIPQYRVFSKGLNEKDEIKKAGLWLFDNHDMQKSGLIVNDLRIAYHAGLFLGEFDLFTKHPPDQFEKESLRRNSNIMAVYLSSPKSDTMSELQNYRLINSFSGRKKTVMIYERKFND